MIIEYEGKSYDFDFEEITVKQAIKIEKHTGMPLSKFTDAAAEGVDMVALQAVGWLILHGGRDVPIEDCDFKVMKLGEAFAKAAAEEEAAQKAQEGQPGPTAAISSAPMANGHAAAPSSLSSAAAG
jgi:hypothetical protein